VRVSEQIPWLCLVDGPVLSLIVSVKSAMVLLYRGKGPVSVGVRPAILESFCRIWEFMYGLLMIFCFFSFFNENYR